jgi:hypothetical protein
LGFSPILLEIWLQCFALELNLDAERGFGNSAISQVGHLSALGGLTNPPIYGLDLAIQTEQVGIFCFFYIRYLQFRTIDNPFKAKLESTEYIKGRAKESNHIVKH